MGTTTAIRVGSDVLSVQQVTKSVAWFGDRYLHRVFTQHEISSASGAPSVQAARLAARFAAKEATIKVLRPIDHQPDWRSMEVQRHAGGWCTMALSGHAADLAEEAGITDLAVSLTHEGDMAAAVVVALCRRNEPDAAGQPGRRVSLADTEDAVDG